MFHDSLLFRTAESNSVCQFYSHSCNEDAARACVFCEEMVVMREMGPLEKPDIKDLASSVVELFTMMAEVRDTRDAGAGIREAEAELGVGRVEPVFLDYLQEDVVILEK